MRHLSEVAFQTMHSFPLCQSPASHHSARIALATLLVTPMSSSCFVMIKVFITVHVSRQCNVSSKDCYKPSCLKGGDTLCRAW